MVGDWISLHASVERKPRRLTLVLTFGELPEGWPRTARHARTWSGVAGLVVLAPFVALLGAGALRAAGLAQPYQWIAGSPAAIVAASVSLFVGIPVAIAMNLWRITHGGFRRGGDGVEGLLALEFAPLHLLVVVIALGIAAAFAGHVAADSYACFNGARSAC